MENFYGTLIGALIGFVASYITIIFSYKNLYADNVSKSRMQWIDNFREEFSEILGLYKTLANNKEDFKFKNENLISRFEKYRVKLLTRLNQDTSKEGNEYNKIFADKIQLLDYNEQFDLELYNELILISRKILEYEWKKVKKEAKGKNQNE